MEVVWGQRYLFVSRYYAKQWWKQNLGQSISVSDFLKVKEYYHLPVWVDVIHSHVFYEAGEPFIEPQIVPPRWRHQISKPLVKQRSDRQVRKNWPTLLLRNSQNCQCFKKVKGFVMCTFTVIVTCGCFIITHLVGQFVGDHHGHPLFVGLGRLLGVVQHGGLSVGDQAPVLHGSGCKVRHGDHICGRESVKYSLLTLQKLLY